MKSASEVFWLYGIYWGNYFALFKNGYLIASFFVVLAAWSKWVYNLLPYYCPSLCGFVCIPPLSRVILTFIPHLSLSEINQKEKITTNLMPTWIFIDRDEQHGPQRVEEDDNFMRENVGVGGEDQQQSPNYIHTRKSGRDDFIPGLY